MTSDLLYSRLGCHLCEDAEAALDALAELVAAGFHMTGEDYTSAADPPGGD